MKNPKGFTLLEVIIAMMIMVYVMLRVITIQSSSIRNVERARERNNVAMLAQRAMHMAEMEIEGKKFDKVFKKADGKFEAPHEKYRWEREITELKFPNLGSLGGEEEGQSSAQMIASKISDLITKYLNKSLRQVTVTIFWKQDPSDEKEMSFVVGTYWVNLDNEFKITF